MVFPVAEYKTWRTRDYETSGVNDYCWRLESPRFLVINFNISSRTHEIVEMLPAH